MFKKCFCGTLALLLRLKALTCDCTMHCRYCTWLEQHAGDGRCDTVADVRTALGIASAASAVVIAKCPKLRGSLEAAGAASTGIATKPRCGFVAALALLRRESPAVFASVYSFIRARYGSRAVLWPSVRRELKLFADLLPLLFSGFEVQLV